MRLAVLAALVPPLTSLCYSAPLSVDDDLPVVSRERLRINTVRRGDLVPRIEARGSLRRSDDASVEAVLPVTSDLVQDMMVGQPAWVGVGRNMHSGRVARIGRAAANEYLVTVAIDGVPSGVNASEPVAASIQTEELNGVLVLGGVPAMRPGSTVSWFKLEPDSDHATRVSVRIGKTAARLAEIWSGLTEGDRVITMGLDLPENVRRVRLR